VAEVISGATASGAAAEVISGATASGAAAEASGRTEASGGAEASGAVVASGWRQPTMRTRLQVADDVMATDGVRPPGPPV
jgi:hypothetical protein